MAHNVVVTLNYNRSELIKPGWAKSRLASTMQPASLLTGVVTAPVPTYIAGPMPENLWREPNTGVIMKKPLTLQQMWWEDPANDAYKIDKSQWTFGNSNNFLGLTQTPFSMFTQRDNSSTGDLAVGVSSVAETALLAVLQTAMVWCMRTNFALEENEGFAVWVHPPGIFTDRAADYMVISFGGRYALHLKMNGTASLFIDQSYFKGGTAGNWVETAQFNLSNGGIDHNKPFQITVIPFGFGYISFQFSQTFTPITLLGISARSPKVASFLYDMAKSEGVIGQYDAITQQYIKTYPAPINVALRKFLFQYGFSWARVRYPSGTTTLATMPESIPEPLGVDPTVLARGFNNQGSCIPSFVNINDVAWNNATDTYPVIKYAFAAGSSHTSARIWTPELWSVDISIPAVVSTSTWTPRVVNHWNLVRFQRSVTPMISVGEVKLDNHATDYAKSLHFWGPIRITYNGTVVFDGYRVKPQPSVSGPLVLSQTQLECHDMWARLDNQLIADYKFLDKLALLDVIKELIKRAGFVDGDILVVDPTGAMAAIQFDGFVDPNEQKSINPDSTVGDVIREIINGYNLIPIRVRPVNGQWKIYLAPQYGGGAPTIQFYIGGLDLNQSDATRYAAHQYKITSEALEYTCEEPEFNGLIARASTGSSEGAQGIEGIIPATYADPDSVSNPASFWYIGRAKVKIVSPPLIPSCVSQGELEKALRVYWERNHRKRPVLEFKGEWQPEIDVDQFIWVIGYNQTPHSRGSLLVDGSGNPLGTVVSYGVYRIDHIDVQITWDPDQATTEGRWHTEASYTCVYVGSYSDGVITTGMFITELPT